MSRRFVASLLGLLVLACQPTTGSDAVSDAKAGPGERTKGPVTELETPPKPATPAAWVEPARTHLLVHTLLPEQAIVSILPIALVEPPIGSSSTGPTSTRASGPSVGVVQSRAAMPVSNWPDHFMGRLAHDGSDRYVAVAGGPEAWKLEVWSVEPSSGPSASFELGTVSPAGLMMVGDQVFLGQGNAVGVVDLAAASPLRELHRRPEMFAKAYDVFVRSGAWMIAIDDVVQPIYADGFRIGPGAPERVQDFTLPSAINGSYYAGELVARGPDSGTLYLLLHYGIMDGHGHDLTALPIAAGKLEVDSGALLNGGGALSNPPVLEEHVDRGTHEPVKLIATEIYSEWTNLAYVRASEGGQPRLWISAVERGLLELPADFDPSTKASVIDLGGAVVDIMLIGGRGYALVNVEQPLARSELVELSPLPTGAAVERRTPLPGIFHRFVH